MQFLFFILMRLSNIVKRIFSYPPTFLTYLSKKKKKLKLKISNAYQNKVWERFTIVN